MELKNPLALYICAGVAVVFFIAAFVTVRLKRKYKGGKKAYLPDYLKNDKSFKVRIVWHTILKYVLIVLIISGILLSGFLMARPYKTQSKQLANYNRAPPSPSTILGHSLQPVLIPKDLDIRTSQTRI